MDNKNKAVVVLIMAQTCGHCRNFKQNNLSKLKSLCSSLPIKLIDVELPTMNTKEHWSPKVPEVLKKYTTWFPTLLIIPAEMWSMDKVGTVPITDVQVFNGKVTEKKDENGEPLIGVEYEQKHPMTPEGITDWIKDKLNNIQPLPASTRLMKQVIQNNFNQFVGGNDSVKNIATNETLIPTITLCQKLNRYIPKS